MSGEKLLVPLFMLALGACGTARQTPRQESIRIYQRDGDSKRSVEITAVNSNALDPAMRAHFLVTADEDALIEYYMANLRDRKVILDSVRDPANPSLWLVRIPSGWVAAGRDGYLGNLASKGYPVLRFGNLRDAEAYDRMAGELAGIDSRSEGLPRSFRTDFDKEIERYLERLAAANVIRGYDPEALIEVDGRRIRVDYALTKLDGRMAALVGNRTLGGMLPPGSWYLFLQLENEQPENRYLEIERVVRALKGFGFSVGREGGVYDDK